MTNHMLLPLNDPRSLMLYERLLRRVLMAPNGCWLFAGARDGGDYGQMRINRKIVRVSRLMYEVTRGPIAPGLFVCHACDTPRCFRPDHLFLGTAMDNAADMIAKGRARPPYALRTHCKQGHELSGANLYLRPDGVRVCNTCRVLRDRARFAARGAPPRLRRRMPLPIERTS